MDTVSKPGSSLDVGDSKLIRRTSLRLSKHGQKDNLTLTEKRVETEATLIPCRITPLNPSPSLSSFSSEDTLSNVVQGGEPDSTSESDNEDAEVKTEQDFEFNEENVTVFKISEESPAGCDVSEDTDMDKTSEHKEEITDTDIKMDPKIDTEQDNVPTACKMRMSAADDLDEMMDIGIVDQVDQEAQMKGEDSVDVDSSGSNTGERKQECCSSQIYFNEADKY